ncbi:MAG: DUF362 domain-containing protein [Candidatus Latescibacterota bacterium]
MQHLATGLHSNGRGAARAVCTAILLAVSVAAAAGAQGGNLPVPGGGRPGQRQAQVAGPPGVRPRVAVVRSDYGRLAQQVAPSEDLTREQIEGIVRAALGELGGMEAFVAPDDQWVVIKPNIVRLSARGRGDITDAYVVWALVKMVHEVSPAARISIAEGSGGWMVPGHPEAMDAVAATDGFANTGFREIAEDPLLAAARIDFIDLNFAECHPVAGRATGDAYWLPDIVNACDVFINVPVLKLTNAIGFTCAMKNMVGTMPGMRYGWPKDGGFPPGSGNPGLPNHRQGRFDEMIVDLAGMAGIDLNVVDALVGMERARIEDEGGKAKRLNTIVAGSDPVAVDAVCTYLAGFNPDDFEFITLGERLGLGVGSLESIETVGQPLAEVRSRFEKKLGWDENAHYGQSNRLWLLKGPFPLDDEARWTPQPGPMAVRPGEDGWSEPVYFWDDRINLKSYLGRQRHCVAYAYAEFQARRDQPAELWVGSDEPLFVWLNGQEVYRYARNRQHKLPNDQQPIAIRQGRNALLVEVVQRWRDFGFSLNICEPEDDERFDGNRVEGLAFTVPGDAAVVDALGSNVMAEEEPFEIVGWHTPRQYEYEVVRIYGREQGLGEGVGNLTIGRDGTVYGRRGGTVVKLGANGERWQGVLPGATYFDRMWVRDLLVDATGRLFAATSGGLLYAEGDTMLTEQSGQWFGEVGEALGRGVFAGGWDVPLLRFDGQRWAGAGLTGVSEQEGPQQRVVSVDGCSRYLWVGTWGAGLYRFDGREWERFTSQDALGDNHCERIVAADGRALVYHDLGGVDWYDGRRWRFYDDRNGLLDPVVQGMAIDRQGRPWVSTEERSLGCLQGGEWATALINKPIESIAVHPDGTLWLSDGGGQVTVLRVR